MTTDPSIVTPDFSDATFDASNEPLDASNATKDVSNEPLDLSSLTFPGTFPWHRRLKRLENEACRR